MPRYRFDVPDDTLKFIESAMKQGLGVFIPPQPKRQYDEVVIIGNEAEVLEFARIEHNSMLRTADKLNEDHLIREPAAPTIRRTA